MPTLPGEGRQRPINFIARCDSFIRWYPERIIDSYDLRLAYALQKEAIQNSVDARAKKSAPVEVEFRVFENEKGEFLTITDKNTTGLTGEVKKTKDYKKLDKDDNWARFESFGFTDKDPNAIGSQGEGKIAFLASSKGYMMFYDTLRGDGIYRLGATEATERGCPIFPDGEEEWEDDFGQEKLKEHCGVAPLKEVGTRIIICKPKKEVLEAIKNGEFVRAIQETWFRCLEKKQLRISLVFSGRTEEIGVPDICSLFEEKEKSHRSWVYGEDFEKPDLPRNHGKIKRFHAVYCQDTPVPEEWRGIAIIHNGMKICSVPDFMKWAPPEIQEKIMGYVEFDSDVDGELRKDWNQNPNHCDLEWQRGLPQSIKKFVQSQMRDFGEKKLGLARNPTREKNERRTDAEMSALREFQRYAKDLNLVSGLSGGSQRKRDSGSSLRKHKEAGITFIGLTFSDESKQPRIDWGEKITFSLEGFNNTEGRLFCKISLRVFCEDTKIETLLNNKKIKIAPKRSERIGSFELLVTKGKYRNEEHRIKATLIDARTAKEIHSLTRKFWVKSDPPAQWPFKLEGRELPHPYAWGVDYEEGKPIVCYNLKHPEYLAVEIDPIDPNDYKDYLLRILLEAGLQIHLETSSHDADGDRDYSPLETKKITKAISNKSPEEIYEECMRYLAEVRWRIKENR